jgi:hypothetical protein
LSAFARDRAFLRGLSLPRAVASCLAAWLLLLPTGVALSQETLEASVKAAYLFKFLAYVDWPAAALPNADSPQVIGIMDADDVHAELQRLVAGRQVNGHPLIARKLISGESVEGLHVLYLGRNTKLSSVMPALRGQPSLTVTDAPAGLAEGAVLNFVLVQGRVRFEASLPAAERAGLKLSARLLAVAERVLTP